MRVPTAGRGMWHVAEAYRSRGLGNIIEAPRDSAQICPRRWGRSGPQIRVPCHQRAHLFPFAWLLASLRRAPTAGPTLRPSLCQPPPFCPFSLRGHPNLWNLPSSPRPPPPTPPAPLRCSQLPNNNLAHAFNRHLFCHPFPSNQTCAGAYDRRILPTPSSSMPNNSIYK